ncbi:hypothetical protein CcCBS67573_g09005 [Chytriomyces confervae]|uniref:Cyclin N-terminal domain-containing protein n=1 Tax=Chytriomyces confervae TaxID=246404 RepID=A0A507E967_9FUNG|nr:hypothetical protein CcCBS67573_g09005 [Chytriomyces confervae]
MNHVSWILSVAQVLELPRHSSTAVALHYWHRVAAFMRRERESHEGQNEGVKSALDEKLLACACLLLACKTCETNRRLRHVLNAAFWIEHSNSANSFLNTDDEMYWQLKDSLIAAELILVRILAFDTHVETPHAYIIHLLQMLSEPLLEHTPSSDSATFFLANENYTRLAQASWMNANDVYLDPRTCLNGDARVLAAACIVLAAQSTHLTHLSRQQICNAARVDEKDVEDAICPKSVKKFKLK